MRPIQSIVGAILFSLVMTACASASPISCNDLIGGLDADRGDAGISVQSTCLNQSVDRVRNDASAELRTALDRWQSNVWKQSAARVYTYTLRVSNTHCEVSTVYLLYSENPDFWIYLQPIKKPLLYVPARTTVTLEFLSPFPPKIEHVSVAQELLPNEHNRWWGMQTYGLFEVGIPNYMPDGYSTLDLEDVILSLPMRSERIEHNKDITDMLLDCK